jgi:SnoaL-like protein
LVEAYAHCADRRDAKGQMSLFTADTHFVVYMDAKDPKPSQELNSRKALAPVFAVLNKYAATMHFVGQSTIPVAEDTAGYQGSKDWTRFYAVFYQAKPFLLESHLRHEMKRIDAAIWTGIVVNGPAKKKRRRAAKRKPSAR